MTATDDPEAGRHEPGVPTSAGGAGAPRSRAVRAVVWSAFESWGSKISSIAVFVVLARLLTPEEFGLIALAQVLLSAVQIIVEAGFGEALVQRRDLRDEHIAAAFCMAAGLGVALAVLVFAGAGVIAGIFGEPRLVPVVRALTALFIFQGLASTPYALLQRELEFRSIALRSVLGSLLGGGAAIVAAFLGAGVWALVFQALVSGAVGAVVLWRGARFRPSFRFGVIEVRELLGFSLVSFGSKIVNFFHRRGDDLLIGGRLGSVQLGFYSVAYRLMRLVDDMVSKVLLNVAFPMFALVQDDRPKAQAAYVRACTLAAAALFPVFTFMSVMAEELIVVGFGDKWQASVTPMRFLSIVGMVNGVQLFSSAVLKATGRIRTVFVVGVISTAANVAGFLVTSPRGITAVAAGYLVTTLALTPLPPWLACRQLGIPVRRWLGAVAGPLAACGVLILAGLGVRQVLADRADLVVLMVASAAAAVAYLTSLAVLAPRVFREAKQIAADLGASRRKRPAARPPASSSR